MAYENKERKELNTNTRGIELYNSDENYPVNSCLKCGYWNNRIVIDIHPKLATPSNGKVFNYEEKMSVTLTEKDAVALNGMVDMVYSEEYDFLALPTAKGFIEFGMKNEELGINTPYINICETNENKEVTGSLTFCFPKTVIIADYNYKDANYNTIETDAELETFFEFLENAVAAGTMAYAHAQVDRTKYSTEKFSNQLVALLENAGIPTSSGNSKSGYTAGKGWSSPNRNRTNTIPSEEVSGDQDIEIC
ncbi:MAG: hypothetical protein ACRCX2_16770 [Paraclostridium sp.]